MNDYEMISVIKNKKGKGLVVEYNPTNYSLISKGKHGAVFKLSDKKCIKVFLDKNMAAREAEAYKKIEGNTICPKFYEAGPNYIIIEYIDGLTLDKHLGRRKHISESIAMKMLFLLQEIKKMGFKDKDFELKNVILTKNDNLRLFDLVNAYHLKKEMPEYLFKDLEYRGLLDMFIEQLKNIDSKAYLEMKHFYEEYKNDR